MRTFFISLFLLLTANFTFSQEVSDDIVEMSLEELMNIEIVSASKKAESIFEAPLSSSVITREQIMNSGATSIMEALRLAPGVIVREQSNGNYDIHLRGMDYVPGGGVLSDASNRMTLVMIDNRIVFRDFQGGTYWESLPIDINDVERIEVVLGPSSALYGPNAVSGVINIITTREDREGFHVYANAAYGSFNTTPLNANISYKKDKFNMMVTGNYMKSDRTQTKYYDWIRKEYVSNLDSILNGMGFGYAFYPNTVNGVPESEVRYPNPDVATDKYGVNAFLNYAPNDNLTFDLSLGLQDNEVQKIFVDNVSTPFSTEASETKYFNFSTAAYGVDFRIAYLDGRQNSVGIPGWEFDFDNLDMALEYELKLLEDKLSIRPGFMYRSVSFDDAVSIENTGVGLLNGKKTLTSTGGFLRADYRIAEPLRIIAALRAEKYNYPDDMYLSYQFGAVYNINPENLIRVMVSRANRGSIIHDTHMDYLAFGGTLYIQGNKDLKLFTMDSYELGFRSKLTEGVRLDADIYYSKAKNFNAMVSAGMDTVSIPNRSLMTFENISTKANQIGGSLKIQYFINQNFEVSPFVAIQKTEITDHNVGFMVDSLISFDHKWTPSYYGGIYINMKYDKFNINLSPYFYSKQTFAYSTIGSGEALEDEIPASFILNATISYKVYKENQVYVTARNLFSGDNVQFGFADPVKAIFMGGIRLNF